MCIYVNSYTLSKPDASRRSSFSPRKVLSCRRSGQTSRVSSGPLGLRKGGDLPRVLQLTVAPSSTVDDRTVPMLLLNQMTKKEPRFFKAT